MEEEFGVELWDFRLRWSCKENRGHDGCGALGSAGVRWGLRVEAQVMISGEPWNGYGLLTDLSH